MMAERFSPCLRGAIVRFGRTLAAALVAGSLAVAPALAAPDSAIVVDAKTGQTLFADNPDAQRYPASLTKMMTLYLLFEAIDSGKAKLSSQIPFSEHATSQAPSKLGAKAGTTISARDAILAIVTKSANDVATAIAEFVGGSEGAFAQRMTAKARQLGMSRTTFRNANGLPDPDQMTTARDMATLGRALREHYPQYYAYFATPSFVWKGRRIGNHDRLLGRVQGVDGIKTGYTRASGFNLVTSASLNGRMLVAVVLGGDSGRERDQRMAGLVQTYLPQASAGKRTAAAIPGYAKAAVAVAAADKVPPAPTAAPQPVAAAPAPAAKEPVAVAEAVAPMPAPVLRPETIAAAPVAPAPAPAPNSFASLLAGANSIFALDAVEQCDTSDDEDETSSIVAPTKAMTGWKIQLAAAPTQSQAEDILDRALGQASKVLRSASPYTEPVVNGNTKLYRARFAGFHDKAAARAACDYLSKRAFKCLTISD
ncbi:hypothetical protein BH10PSE9_BH10PSE9_06760 [soil metagenome]